MQDNVKSSGRPTKYKPEYDHLILTDDFCGLFLVQIANKLDVDEATLYRWAKEHPSFCQSLNRARANCSQNLLDKALQNITTDRDTKLNERTLENLMQISGLNRRIPELVGVDDEHKALAIVQDAVADGRLLSHQAESHTKVITAKLEARKVLEMAQDIANIKEQLGIE